MKRTVAIPICIALAVIAIPVCGWLWSSWVMEDMMFVPNQHSTDRLRTDLEPLFGDPIMSATVVRVDRDTNLIFFTFKANQVEIESTKAALEEQGWSARSSSSSSKVTFSVIYDLGESHVRLLQLEALDQDTYYGGYQYAGGNLNFETRYEENKVYAQQAMASSK